MELIKELEDAVTLLHSHIQSVIAYPKEALKKCPILWDHYIMILFHFLVRQNIGKCHVACLCRFATGVVFLKYRVFYLCCRPTFT